MQVRSTFVIFVFIEYNFVFTEYKIDGSRYNLDKKLVAFIRTDFFLGGGGDLHSLQRFGDITN